jgi:hypothetical protein
VSQTAPELDQPRVLAGENGPQVIARWWRGHAANLRRTWQVRKQRVASSTSKARRPLARLNVRSRPDRHSG